MQARKDKKETADVLVEHARSLFLSACFTCFRQWLNNHLEGKLCDGDYTLEGSIFDSASIT